MAAIDVLFPDLRPIPQVAMPPAEPRISLARLEQMALANSPVIAQAEADVTSFLGTAVQAGTPPNPVVGYEADTVTSSQTRNYQGLYFNQLIKTGGKLNLARAVANFDVMNSQLALRRTRIDVLARVKAGYFAVLVAEESVRLNEALVLFTGESYQIQDDKLKAGAAAPYEVAQLRSLAVQARMALVQAQNRYISAWKQLASTIGIPDLPVARLEGSAEVPPPVLTYDAAMSRMLSLHPDMQAARNVQAQARTQLRLDLIKPVPDVLLYGTFQKDYTTPNYGSTSYNLQVGVPLPIFDRNRGNIINSRGDVLHATQQTPRIVNDLVAQLADAFERFETNRINLQYLRAQIQPDLVWAYNGVRSRFNELGENGPVGFGDIIVAQQNLAAGVSMYLATLGAQWQAVTDLARLLQVENLEELNLGSNPAPVNPPPVQAGPK
jgi:cobalt-zinc-cadmium efflux system outer membrane protein